MNKRLLNFLTLLFTFALLFSFLTSCGDHQVVSFEQDSVEDDDLPDPTDVELRLRNLTKDDIVIENTYKNSKENEHVVVADFLSTFYKNLGIYKTGDTYASSADISGSNSAVFVTNGSSFELSDSYIYSNGAHADGYFSYGSGSSFKQSLGSFSGFGIRFLSPTHAYFSGEGLKSIWIVSRSPPSVTESS